MRRPCQPRSACSVRRPLLRAWRTATSVLRIYQIELWSRLFDGGARPRAIIPDPIHPLLADFSLHWWCPSISARHWILSLAHTPLYNPVIPVFFTICPNVPIIVLGASGARVCNRTYYATSDLSASGLEITGGHKGPKRLGRKAATYLD